MHERQMRVFFPGGMRVDAEFKGFLVKTDQPLLEGGEGLAPSPFDLFLASLATCAGYYVLAFCQERGISIASSFLMMRTKKNPQTKMIDTVFFEIHLPPDFPEKYKGAVIKAASSCAVEAHILNPPEFKIEAITSK